MSQASPELVGRNVGSSSQALDDEATSSRGLSDKRRTIVPSGSEACMGVGFNL